MVTLLIYVDRRTAVDHEFFEDRDQELQALGHIGSKGLPPW